MSVVDQGYASGPAPVTQGYRSGAAVFVPQSSLFEGGYGLGARLIAQGYRSSAAIVPQSSLFEGGYGLRPRLIAQGFGAPIVGAHGRIRETFWVPLPDGETATRHAPSGRPPYLGSLESGISFALDFSGWLDQAAGETLLSSTTSALAFPQAAGSVPYDATGTLVRAQQTTLSATIVTLSAAVAQTFYALIVSATTSTGRTLECRMPRIWCPD